MEKNELKNAMSVLGLTPIILGRLIDVTPRAIALWLNGERSIPGPVEAYLKLFAFLPAEMRQQEMLKAQEETNTMRDGLYSIEFSGRNGFGYGVLVFDNGRVYGSDVGLGQYDGVYKMNPLTGEADIRLRVQMPAGSESILGPAQPFAWGVDVDASMDPRIANGEIFVRTSMGEAKANYRFMRSLPNH